MNPIEIFSIISVSVIFIIIMIVFSIEKVDFLAIALFGALIAALILIITTGDGTLDFQTFMGYIEWQPLVFIISMQIIIAIAEKRKLFHYIAVKAIHITKGNGRTLFYFIIIVSTFTAAVVADVTVSIIFAPLLIKACRVLEIKPAPYLFGMTICINIGSLITPFSSAENIIIASHFDEFPDYNVGIEWFLSNVFIFGIFMMLFTLFLLDLTMLKRSEPVGEERKKLIRELLLPKLVYENRKEFQKNGIVLLIIFISFFIIPEAAVVALVGAVVMVLLNREKLADYFKTVEWDIIFFFSALYIIIGVMSENQTIDLIGNFIDNILPENVLAIAIFFLILSSLFSGFLANSPTALVFLALSDKMIETNPLIAANPNMLIIAILIGINLGGNFLPQGAACDVMTLNIAIKNKVEGFNFKTLTKTGATYALVHLGLGLLYLLLYYFIFF